MVRKLTKSIKGNLSGNVNIEREERWICCIRKRLKNIRCNTTFGCNSFTLNSYDRFFYFFGQKNVKCCKGIFSRFYSWELGLEINYRCFGQFPHRNTDNLWYELFTTRIIRTSADKLLSCRLWGKKVNNYCNYFFSGKSGSKRGIRN